MGPAATIWRSVLWFFLEGFALYGASVHWVATTAVTAIANEVDARQRERPTGRERRQSISLVSSVARAEETLPDREDAIHGTAWGIRMPSTSRGFAFGGREIERYRFVQPAWLVMIRRAVAGWWVKWRRECEVSKAVRTLAEYDDRTLRDLGIHHRSEIEQILRGGRNG